jgi:hypothetical protein
MKIYIIWNKKENRPVICSNFYGSMLVYLAKENAQAYMADESNSDFEVVEKEI